ncbi:ABC transporter permease [Desulfatitalea tepidiphila]|uniref:ABC transporter permease n=1 Tax=Desulfatitalea tepidiphila TaxID=1185843 RepID=UPI0013792974|nr:ABC transporter permease [Desulfatitalea tepidiphila]
MSILLPIIYLVILGNSFQGKLQGLPIVVVDQDGAEWSQRLMDNLRALVKGPKTVTLDQTSDENQAIRNVRQGRYKACLIIPMDFSKKKAVKAAPEVALFLDNTDGISSETIRNVVTGALRAIALTYVPLREDFGSPQLNDINLYQQVDYRQSLVPGVIIMAIFLGTQTTGAFNLVMDRFLGVDESYMLTPLSKGDIVGGLIISGLTVTTIIAVFIMTVGMLITGISFSRTFGHFALLLLIIVLTTMSLLSLMFVLLGRLRHPRVVGIISGFMNVILFFPSGAVYPIASFPEWLKLFATINP